MTVGESLPIVLIPGILCTPRLFAPQLPHLWRRGPITVADHTRDETMTAMARRVLEHAPGRFALIGLSMGGYLSFEIMRQAPERVIKLALLDTSARADSAEQTERRHIQMAMARNGRFEEITDLLFPRWVHPRRAGDEQLRTVVRTMAQETGSEAFVRQQLAIMSRPDSLATLGGIACPTLVVVGDQDELTPPDRAREMASAIPGARLVIVPDSGHLSTLEQPDAVTRALIDFV